VLFSSVTAGIIEKRKRKEKEKVFPGRAKGGVKEKRKRSVHPRLGFCFFPEGGGRKKGKKGTGDIWPYSSKTEG